MTPPSGWAATCAPPARCPRRTPRRASPGQRASVIAVSVAGGFEVLEVAAHIGYRVGMPAPVCQKKLVHVAVLVDDAARPEAFVLLVRAATVLAFECGQ